MKKTILLMFSLFLFSGAIFGQNGKFGFLDRNTNKDFNITNRQSNFSQIDTTFKLIPNHDLFHKRDSKRFDLNPDMIIQRPLGINHSQSYAYAEEYPGSSRYYAKMPFKNQMTYEKSFIIKPDTSVKCYLIIKNPLSHMAIR